jgi:hypothetical protein
MEELKRQIEDWLKANGFKYHEDSEKPNEQCWYLYNYIPGPTQTIIINGETHTQQTPPSLHAIALNWDEELAWVENEDGSCHVEFLMFKIMSMMNDKYSPIYVSISDLQDLISVISNLRL